MYHYEYVSRNEAKPYRQEIENILHEVQELVRDCFTFQYSFIGSSARNMITFDPTTNTGFDFDVNIFPNDWNNQYSAKELKIKLMQMIDRVAPKYGFRPCENSTRVITIKKVDRWSGAIVHSCDFAIVNDFEDKKGNLHQEFIKFRKKNGEYLWQEQTSGYNLDHKIVWIKAKGLWNDVFDLYLDKKNYNTNHDKKSRALFAETINEICQKNGYKSDNKV